MYQFCCSWALVFKSCRGSWDARVLSLLGMTSEAATPGFRIPHGLARRIAAATKPLRKTGRIDRTFSELVPMCTWAHADRFFLGNTGNVTKLEVKATEQSKNALHRSIKH